MDSSSLNLNSPLAWRIVIPPRGNACTVLAANAVRIKGRKYIMKRFDINDVVIITHDYPKIAENPLTIGWPNAGKTPWQIFATIVEFLMSITPDNEREITNFALHMVPQVYCQGSPDPGTGLTPLVFVECTDETLELLYLACEEQHPEWHAAV
jgi:hypothetical protein